MNALRYLPFVRRGLVRGGPPLHLTVFVTGVCNLRCRHCFHHEAVAAAVQGPSLAELTRLADSAARLGPLLWVSFGGGEPLLRRDLPRLGEAFARHGLRHLAIPTNGLVEAHQHELVEELVARCPDTYVSLAVSIDGPPAVHDAIRAEPGAHARALASLARYREQAARHANLGVGVILTVTRENQDVLAAHLEELVRAHRPDNVTLNLARTDALDRTLLDVDLARYDEVVATKARLVREGLLGYFDVPLARVAAARDRLMYRRVAAERRGTARFRPCSAGSLSAVVFEDGDVRPCEVLDASLGNLREVDWDLGRLWRAPRAEELRRRIVATRCACTWECAKGDDVLFDVRGWPRLAWEALRA
ncbi:MAG: radical SAM protein [Planctomycetes bacterium]|nr:radical SAM protein [Planctomycetota bacterium]